MRNGFPNVRNNWICWVGSNLWLNLGSQVQATRWISLSEIRNRADDGMLSVCQVSYLRSTLPGPRILTATCGAGSTRTSDCRQGTRDTEQGAFHFSSVPLEMRVPGSLVGTWNASAKSRVLPWVVCVLVGWQDRGYTMNTVSKL